MDKEYKVANISTEALEKINELQQTLKDQLGKDIVLIAYTKDAKENMHQRI